MLHSLLGIAHFSFFFFGLFFCLECSVLATDNIPSHPEREESRMPLKVKLRGFLNTKPEGDSTLIKLSIGIYRETYQFELVSIEAVDRERVTAQQILAPTESREIAYDLTGPKELLSKIAAFEPGTPLAITGFLQQRARKIQVTDVEIIGFGK